ncbi:nucleotide exchange factor GrpE [Candidatus Woesebacteria bacterium RBG_19FT_COMBO_47_8]|uniref:Protein GrpE n=1 Tax=Candidatus Woesebacteria bacterium RBG_13_46_13 TaxID=1802479 RepID=A0A1F7X5P2_9BACT|nr:MAG: nucleotide exchange factor GrpE [Candidatus Woesebacteria bacterium RBG_13_46_13]OGM16782.1 MAG: nucleotide exchange factor GrpE [Candidatus Woesebacteria bacterium RBG_19FT_COMBO_47_8]HJX59194.1 nucleotide exchange factor GrpE [Patescibacteria group bacterium]
MKKNPEINLKAQLARALADYDNLVKRVEREKYEFEKKANLKLAIRLLPVLDILKQAQRHLGDPGIAITIVQFEDALKAEGIEEINVAPGDNFDTQLHEAVEVVEEGKGKGKIKEIVMTGWRFNGGSVIRHAKVKVSKKG